MKTRSNPHFHIELKEITLDEYNGFRIELMKRRLTMQEWFTRKIKEELQKDAA